MNSKQQTSMVVAGINFAICAWQVGHSNFGLAVLSAGIALMALTLVLLPSYSK